MTTRRDKSTPWVICASLFASCFHATLETRPPDADVLPADAGTDTSSEQLRDGEAVSPPHSACMAPGEPATRAAHFERRPFWDEELLNAFLDEDCDAIAPLPACDRDTPCAYGKCLQLSLSAAGVCVDDARCEAALVFQDGRCTACVRHREKAAICCHPPRDVDCRRWRPARASDVGGSCAEDGDCEQGLWCAAGRGEPWLGTCACPGASLDQLSTFQGCGTPDSDRDSEPELPVFTQENKAHPWLVGDGIAAEVVNLVRFFLGDKASFAAEPVTAPQAAICDFLLERDGAVLEENRLRPMVENSKHPIDLIVLQFWGHATSPCMAGLVAGSEAYYERVLQDASRAVAEIEAAAHATGRHRPRLLWVLQGPDAEQPERIRRLNQIYGLVASEHGDRTSDAGREVSLEANYYLLPDPENRYVWAEFLPCTEEERSAPSPLCTNPDDYAGVTRIHRAGEKVQFCLAEPDDKGVCPVIESPGVARYASVIRRDLLRWLDL